MNEVATTSDACDNCGAGLNLRCICGIDADAPRVAKVLAAFEAAGNMRSYAAAKRLCCQLFPNPRRQLTFVEAARTARARIEAATVATA